MSLQGGGGEGDGGGGLGDGGVGGGEGGEDGGGGESDAHGVCTYNSVWLTTIPSGPGMPPWWPLRAPTAYHHSPVMLPSSSASG